MVTRQPGAGLANTHVLYHAFKTFAGIKLPPPPDGLMALEAMLRCPTSRSTLDRTAAVRKSVMVVLQMVRLSVCLLQHQTHRDTPSCRSYHVPCSSYIRLPVGRTAETTGTYIRVTYVPVHIALLTRHNTYLRVKIFLGRTYRRTYRM